MGSRHHIASPQLSLALANEATASTSSSRAVLADQTQASPVIRPAAQSSTPSPLADLSPGTFAAHPAPPQLWAALHFPELALFSTQTSHGSQHNEPRALFEEHKGQSIVSFCNTAAQARGIQAGMKLASAWGLCAKLTALVRNHRAEQRQLERLAQWALQFTPTVSLRPPNSLLLELQASLQLFGGAQALQHKLQDELRTHGHRVHVCLAATPLAALWLAKAGIEAVLPCTDSIQQALAQLPLHSIELDERTRNKLQRIGVESLRDLMRLPRDGIARRYGKNLLAQLDAAFGRRSDLQIIYQSPEHFHAGFCFTPETLQQDWLLHACSQLLDKLCQQLQLQHVAVDRLYLRLYHGKDQHSRLVIGMQQAHCEPDYLLQLCRLRLEAFPLPAPVQELHLYARNWLARAVVCNDFFTAPVAQQDLQCLLGKLSLRLGLTAIQTPKAIAAHCPEQSNQTQMPGQKSAAQPHSFRPLLLHTTPMALGAQKPSGTLLRGPERIETGWWSKAPIARDYFVLQRADRACWWIFRERKKPHHWFLHGLFA